MKFRETIFNYFSFHDHQVDIMPDAMGKGVNQRFNEVVGKYIDEELLSKIDNLVANNLLPDVAYDRLIPYLEQRVGVELVMGNSMEWRRRVLAHILHWYKIKGTIRAYKLMLGMLGFKDVRIVENFKTNSFDSPLTFDDPDRVFDMSKCNQCVYYDVQLFGDNVQLTPEIKSAIDSVIKFNEPINAKRRTLKLNDKPLITKIISVWIDDNGDLHYSNDYDVDLIMELGEDGDLRIKGENAKYYSINENGDIVYTYE